MKLIISFLSICLSISSVLFARDSFCGASFTSSASFRPPLLSSSEASDPSWLTEMLTDEVNDAFYAISSLRFYLEDQEKEIIFSSEDLDQLWKRAASDGRVIRDVVEAHLLYHQGNLEHTKIRLEQAWMIFKRKYSASLKQIDGFFCGRNDENVSHLRQNDIYPNFTDNPLFNNEMKRQISPYLLSPQHPLKSTLDEIFTRSRAIENNEAFAEAGFETISSFMRVARHPLLPGYLVKVFLDSEHRLNGDRRKGWERLVDRCEGASNIRRLIEKENIQHFVVPDKWIYPLPVEPSPMLLPGKERQLAVLLVTDMDLVHSSECREAWKTKITPKHLEELYCIVSHGYASTYLTANVAYTRQGKFACIDTEYPKRKLNYNKVLHYLSDEMAEYWDRLVRTGGRVLAIQE